MLEGKLLQVFLEGCHLSLHVLQACGCHISAKSLVLILQWVLFIISCCAYKSLALC